MPHFKETFLVKWLKSWRRPKFNAFVGIPWVRWKKLFLKGAPGQMVFADDVETKAKRGGVAQMEGRLIQESRSCRDVSMQWPEQHVWRAVQVPAALCRNQQLKKVVIWWRYDPQKIIRSWRGRKLTARIMTGWCRHQNKFVPHPIWCVWKLSGLCFVISIAIAIVLRITFV